MKKIIVLFVSIAVSFSIQAKINSQAIHVEVKGEGDPILLIPGFTVPGNIWYPLVEKLESKYECHIVTLAGFGGKEPVEFPWLPKVNESLKAYILNNNLEKVTLIGHSLGGTVATWLATQEELDISQIILIDALPASGALMFPNFDPETLMYESSYNNQLLTLDDSMFEQTATAMSKNLSLKVSEQEKIKNWILETDRKTYVYGYTDYLKLDLREDLKKVSVPVNIIAASEPYGKEIVHQTYKNQYANMKDYNLIIAEESGHFIMLDKPDWFIEQTLLILSNQ
ncbi:alpha/beta fold hydrolase [Belliella kenyensis]|uniref:Alpha/beta fold hydrolase n=1 Tax=Belliella kenyensis TaxID=1472724 RepID=A0ABV8EF42_9BACT|nr:alpha/beta hydrolase [Belliella kenyensis]MCH7401839.1 alpha/beta hydrolase [Belliella kenyensis]MDN3604339.1 alpha/beta hydrolase [Belliella kenyensis]